MLRLSQNLYVRERGKQVCFFDGCRLMLENNGNSNSVQCGMFKSLAVGENQMLKADHIVPLNKHNKQSRKHNVIYRFLFHRKQTNKQFYLSSLCAKSKQALGRLQQLVLALCKLPWHDVRFTPGLGERKLARLPL